MRMRHTALLLAGLLAAGGCASTSHEEEILRELANMEKEAIFARAQELFEQKEYADARRYFSFLYDTFPNDPLGHRAALRVADTYMQKRDTTSLTEARLRYRDFASRYPNDPDRDYALFMLGNTYTSRKAKPQRDLSSLEQGLDAYQQLVNLYPQSEHVDEARARMAAVRSVLAQHELMVARFYARNNEWRAVVWRLEYVQEKYPDYALGEEALALLETARGHVAAQDEALEKFRAAQEEAKEAVDADVAVEPKD